MTRGVSYRAAAQRTGRLSGFTLIEVLIAIAALALLTLMAWRGIDAMQGIASQTARHDRELANAQAALMQWGMDLDAIQPLPHIEALDWDGKVLRLTRRHPLSEEAGVLVIAWTQRGAGTQGHWLRWQSAPVLNREGWQQAWQAAQQWAHQGTTAQRAREVATLPLQDWQLFYYRSNAWTHPLSSGDPQEKPSEPTGAQQTGTDAAGLQLPDGIRIELQVPPGHPLTGRLTRDWINPRLGGGKS